jgi:hypothetical protein
VRALSLNRIDVTGRFSPTPGGHDLVVLFLAPGSNVLVLTVEGSAPAGSLRRSGRLVLVVP